jgi:alpha-N-acetylglucosaminidase
LIKGFYKPRWEQFFLYLKTKMINGSRMETNDYEKEIKEWEWKWVNSHDAYSASSEGNSIEIAQQLFEKYAPLIAEDK